MKKILSLLVLFSVTLSCLCFTVSADGDYKVKLSGNSTGAVTVTADKETAKEGETVIFSVTVDDNFLLTGFFVTYNENDTVIKTELFPENDGTYKFLMPDADIRAYASVEKNWHNEKIELDFSHEYGYGEVFLNKYYAYYGDEIEIRVKPKEGMTVEYLLVNGIEIPMDTMIDDMFKYTYIVDTRKVEIDVKFRSKSSTLYDIYIDQRIGGTGFSDKKQANPGDIVTISVMPNPGKDFVTVTCDNKVISGEDNKFTFVMPDHKVTVDIICKAEALAEKPTWEKVEGKWKLKGVNEKYIIGWYKMGSDWYFLDNAANMVTGWAKDKNIWYYLGSSGAMKTGWVKDNGNWYFMDSTGAMKTGWVLSANKWYYLLDSGKMATNTYIDNQYKVGADGAWIE